MKLEDEVKQKLDHIAGRFAVDDVPLDEVVRRGRTVRARRYLAAGLTALLLGAGVAIPVLLLSPMGGSPSPTPSVRQGSSGLHPVSGYAFELCSGNAVPVHCPRGEVPASLRRPLHLPALPPGQTCPVTLAHPIVRGVAPVAGPGPVYVALPSGRLKFVYPPDRGPWRITGWSGQKVLWVASRSYSGPVLIRGGQIDGSSSLGFDLGRDPRPWSELQLPPASHADLRLNGGWRYWPSYTRLRAPGCYAYQVDGANFSYVIVFKAVATD